MPPASSEATESEEVVENSEGNSAPQAEGDEALPSERTTEETPRSEILTPTPPVSLESHLVEESVSPSATTQSQEEEVVKNSGGSEANQESDL